MIPELSPQLQKVAWVVLWAQETLRRVRLHVVYASPEQLPITVYVLLAILVHFHLLLDFPHACLANLATTQTRVVERAVTLPAHLERTQLVTLVLTVLLAPTLHCLGREPARPAQSELLIRTLDRTHLLPVSPAQLHRSLWKALIIADDVLQVLLPQMEPVCPAPLALPVSLLALRPFSSAQAARQAATEL